MDGRSYPDASDGCCFAARRDICAGFAVLLSDAAESGDQDPELSDPVAAVVQTRWHVEIAAVFAAFRCNDGWDRFASDAAARRQRVCGRDDDRDRSAACGDTFHVCCAVPAAAYAQYAFDPPQTIVAYEDRDTACFTHLSARRAYRQRESAARADHGTARDPDRSSGRSADAAGTVSETVRKRHSLRRTTCFRRIAGVRQCRNRLRLRTGADADRQGAGGIAGKYFTV